ncbi:MAG TPA: NAD(P)/FAD-dependent oxidoreductase [Clostridia bacterium]|nr:NAD(P)/FAD-dependent oxidoreductase [Clostridia bacterium]
MAKSIIIIGAGMGGMSSGIYGQMNGFRTRIFEMHYLPGGQCASWQRKGYTFDVCIHHLMGCSPNAGINRLWTDLGAMPRELAYTKECVSVVSHDGKILIDYYDLDKLEKHLLEIAPQDKQVIHDYIEGIRLFKEYDFMDDLMMGNIIDVVKNIPAVLRSLKWFKPTMADYAGRFSDPFLQKAFQLMEYSIPECPFALHLLKHASGCRKDIAWPIGASEAFAGSIAKRYEALGGEIHYRKKVTRIITRDGKAVGVELADGSEEYADIIISNADGRKTLLELLEGRYMNTQLGEYCGEPADETNWAVHVFLGVDRDLSKEPSSIVMLLNEPVTIAGHETRSLEMQTYGFDRTMAPEGKGVIKVELVSKYSYWKELARDRQSYEAEKQKVAEQVIELLENHFHGIREQIEVVDVPTLLTWERFMGGTHGFANFPNKKTGFFSSMIKSSGMTVPGLDNFYFAGVWATSAGALFANALSGKKVIQRICRKERQKFSTQTM